MVRYLSVVIGLLGLWLIVAPVVIGYQGMAAINDLVLGATVLFVAVVSAAALPRFTASSWVTLCCGIWVVFAPAWLGYEQLQLPATNDVAIGLLITLLAAIRICSRDPLYA